MQNGSDNAGGGRRYNGRRSAKGRRYRVKMDWRKLDRQKLLMAFFGLVLLISVIVLISYIARSQNTKKTNAELKATFEAALSQVATDSPAPEATAAAATDTAQETPSPQPEEPEDEPQEETAAPENTTQTVPETTAAPVAARPTLRPAYQTISIWSGIAAVLPELQVLYSENSDLVGWLSVAGEIDLPVVYRDNSYYMYRDFYGNDNSSGTLFLDVLHPLDAGTQHLLIHGHNMKDGTMFGLLTHYQGSGYPEKHTKVNFTTLFSRDEYEVFGVCVVDTDPESDRYVQYWGTESFKTEDDFYQFLEQLKARASWWSDTEVTPADALLTLSTCLSDDRLLILCKRVND